MKCFITCNGPWNRNMIVSHKTDKTDLRQFYFQTCSGVRFCMGKLKLPEKSIRNLSSPAVMSWVYQSRRPMTHRDHTLQSVIALDCAKYYPHYWQILFDHRRFLASRRTGAWPGILMNSWNCRANCYVIPKFAMLHELYLPFRLVTTWEETI